MQWFFRNHFQSLSMSTWSELFEIGMVFWLHVLYMCQIEWNCDPRINFARNSEYDNTLVVSVCYHILANPIKILQPDGVRILTLKKLGNWEQGNDQNLTLEGGSSGKSGKFRLTQKIDLALNAWELLEMYLMNLAFSARLWGQACIRQWQGRLF